jgi:hypothetical protein
MYAGVYMGHPSDFLRIRLPVGASSTAEVVWKCAP